MEDKNKTTDIALIKQSLQYIQTKVDKIEERLEANYVTKEEFNPVKRIAWSLLLLIIGGAISLVVYLGRGVTP